MARCRLRGSVPRRRLRVRRLRGYPFGGAVSVVSAGSPWRSSRDRSASALTSAPTSSARELEPEPGEHDDNDREGAPGFVVGAEPAREQGEGPDAASQSQRRRPCRSSESSSADGRRRGRDTGSLRRRAMSPSKAGSATAPSTRATGQVLPPRLQSPSSPRGAARGQAAQMPARRKALGAAPWQAPSAAASENHASLHGRTPRSTPTSAFPSPP